MLSKNNVNYLYRLSAALFLILAAISCSDNSNPFDNVNSNVANTNFYAVETFSQNVAVNNQSVFTLNAVSGTIKINTTEGALVKIYGERRVESQSTEDAEAWLNGLKVQVEDRGDEVYVQTIQPEKTNGRNLLVNYNIEIPASWAVSIDNVNGDVQADSLTGGFELNLVNGRILLHDLFCGVNVNLTNGNIESRIALPQQENILMNLVNGSIDLQIPQTTSADVVASVVNGSVIANNLNFQTLSSSARRLSGTIGSGLGTITLATVNGTISILGY
ncbi:MAG: DUF4097 family beta strand repeat protein [Calditrichaeota bacterium]|nr:DUF4097 family beta strand repeat protein [Calditrichota bacterium]